MGNQLSNRDLAIRLQGARDQQAAADEHDDTEAWKESTMLILETLAEFEATKDVPDLDLSRDIEEMRRKIIAGEFG